MTTFKEKFRLRTPSRTENLELIRDFVSRIAQKVGFNEDDIYNIELAVDEACTNVIKHAYDKNKQKDIDVVVEVGDDKFTVVISDRGKGFDPNTIKGINMTTYLSQMRVGGLGIHLMRLLMDKVEYDIRPGVRTRVKMTKYVNKNIVAKECLRGEPKDGKEKTIRRRVSHICQ